MPKSFRWTIKYAEPSYILYLWHVPKHEAEARVGQVCINTSQTVLKSLRSVDLFGCLWQGAS